MLISMKMSTLVATFSLSCTVSMGQGTLIFANFGGGVNAPITSWDGKFAGSDFMADLWLAPGMVTDSAQLVELGRPASFSGQGIFLGGVQKIPEAAGGTVITAQVRAWHTTPECVWCCCDEPFQLGASDLFQVILASDPSPPVFLTGLLPFGISAPTTRTAPNFRVRALVGNKLLFTWPPSALGTNFMLEENADLGTTNWVKVAEIPIFVAPQFQITVPRPAGTMFYRLMQ